MKVLYLFSGTEAEEPQAVNMFIAGYESNGATWGGTIDTLENFANDDFTEEFLRARKAEGYDAFIRNSSINAGYTANYNLCKELDMMHFTPVGDNAPVFVPNFERKGANLICGSGTSEYGNATSYPCHFYDADPAESEGVGIADIRQCGTVYNITHIQRRSSTRMLVTLDGVTNTDSIGLHTHGTPVYFADISGSDISPLPSGLKYVTYSGTENFFYIDHTTTSGTINAGWGVGNYQSVSAGTMTYGDTDPTQALVRYESYLALFPGQGLTFSGVGGFDNNPNGLNASTWWSEVSGWGDICKIEYTLGSGSYAGGARLYYITQSYSTPYIAGKLAYIKDNLGTTWDDAIGLAMVTASEGNVLDTYNGYGIINPLAAITYSAVKTLTAPVLTQTINAVYSTTLSWDIIPFAKSYEIYFRDELLETLPANVTSKLCNISRQNKSKLNLFKVRAVNERGNGEFSNTVELPYYLQLGILVKKNPEGL